jgi:Outer membrane protein beta-barrel domain
MWVTRFAFGIVALLLTSAASAQDVPLPALSFGYEFQRFSGDGESLNVPKWVNVDFAYPLARAPISVIGQYDYGQTTETATQLGTQFDVRSTFNTYAFGVRWTAPITAGTQPFVQVLSGAQRYYFRQSLAGAPDFETDSDWGTDALFQFGGGIAVPLTRRWSALGQIDYRRIFADEGVNNVRFVAGFRLSVE